MGKGKRNRQLHVEDTIGAPKKTQNKSKKQFVMPVWAKRAICIVLLVAVLAGIIAAALISGGIVLRNRILVESESGKFDMNQQMATFILWYTMYQQASYEWQNAYYQQYFGGSKSEILTQYQSPDSYGVSMAAYYTKEVLNSGLNSISDYLIELVAGADAALNAGLKYEAHDKEDAKGVVTWMQNLYLNLGFAQYGYTFDYFLSEFVGESFKTSDIEDAAKVMIMYSKYSDYMNFELQDDPSKDALQDFILKNPAGFFETKYYAFTGAEDAMIRDFFSDKFMDERFESTVAKHFANTDRLVLTELKDTALTEKLEALGLNTTTKYTKTTNDDGEATYSPELNEFIGEYIFSASNKAGTFAAISGEKCAYLVYFEKTSTATEATISFKEYKYEDYKDNLSEIENAQDLIAECIKTGENVTDFMTDNEKAADLLAQMQDGDVDLPDDKIVTVDTTKPLEKDDTNTAPKSILDALYAKDASAFVGWQFVVNDTNQSYVVKVVDIEKNDEGKNTTNYTVSYFTFTDDLFAGVLSTFEAEYKLYLLETKVTAPTYNDEDMTFEKFEEKVVNWLLDENFKELVLTRYANADLKELTAAMADSNEELLTEKLSALFANGLEDFTKSYATEKEFETEYDSKVYDYIFNSKNKDTATVITGKDDRVFLVYVAPAVEEEEEGHEGHDHDNLVHAAIKEYKFADYEASLKISDSEDAQTFREQILADLLADDRKNTATAHKSADDLAKAELTALKATTDTKTWEDFESVETTKPAAKAADDKNTAPQAIIDKIYPSGNSTTKISLTTETYYQVDDAGTSYIIKITEINTATLACKVEYKTFEDSEYYSYFRAIKSKLDSSLKEDSTTLKYPESITEGTYQDWLFKSEYKDGERKFDRVKNDLTFIANVDTKNNITAINIYIVDEPAKQVNDEEKTIYAAYQLFETEKEAQKALKKLNGKTGFALVDLFTSLKLTETMGKNNEEGYPAEYVVTTSPTISLDMVKSDVSDENLKNWLFDANRQAYNVEIIKSAKDEGYYLALYVSGEEAWTRSARTGWTEEQFAEHMKKVIADGGYKINEQELSKIEGVITTTPAANK